MRKSFKVFAYLFLFTSLYGCDKLNDSELAASCPPSNLSSESKIGNPDNPSDCKGLLLMCNFCEYDNTGIFKRAGSETCGLCVGAEF